MNDDYFEDLKRLEEAKGILLEAFSVDLESKLMEERSCFRTEVRNTKHYICGIHTNSGSWDHSLSACPEIVANVSSVEFHVLNRLANLLDL